MRYWIKMKEYKCIKICCEGWETQDMLNEFAKKGWSLVCSYAISGSWLILEREKSKLCKTYGK